MGRTYEAVEGEIRAFLLAQKVFFVATAPRADAGHINLSPKGLDTFRILGPRTVAYLDFTGSGAETVAHLRENGRIVAMFCAFEGPPKIVRLHGRGEAVLPAHPEFPALRGAFASAPDVRSIVRIAVERISDSCGYGVPRLRFEGDRDQLAAWARSKGEAGLAAYRREKNARSIDGLPALDAFEGGNPEAESTFDSG